MPERILILGAGASNATHALPVTDGLLAKWEPIIRDRYPLLGLALAVWAGPSWPKANLEKAWTRIDLAWKERTASRSKRKTRNLHSQEVEEVLRSGAEAASKEHGELIYYRAQYPRILTTPGSQGHLSPEQFLSVVAGFELRQLIQQEFVVQVESDRCGPYERVVAELTPTAVISFNYDTLFEQFLGLEKHYYPRAGVTPTGVPVLKPHGSVNWTHIGGPAGYVEFGRQLLPMEMGSQDGRMQQNMVIGLRDKIEHTPSELSIEIRGTFEGILFECERVLSEAERLWVVGYGFPAADVSFLRLVRRAVDRRKKRLSVTVISYGQPEKYLRTVRSMLRLPPNDVVQNCFCGFKRWFEHGFCRQA